MRKRRILPFSSLPFLLLSCGFPPSVASSERPYVPTQTAFLEFRDSFQRIARLQGDERLLETAKLEAWLQDEGYLSLSYRAPTTRFVTRFYSMNKESKYGGSIRKHNLSDAVATVEPIKKAHYEAIRASNPATRQEVKEKLVGYGYTLKDSLYFAEYDTDLAHYSNYRGLFKGWKDGEPILDLAKSIAYDEKASGYLVEIKDHILHDPNTGVVLGKAAVVDLSTAFSKSDYYKLVGKGLIAAGISSCCEWGENAVRYFDAYQSPIFHQIFNEDLGYPWADQAGPYIEELGKGTRSWVAREDALEEDIVHRIEGKTVQSKTAAFLGGEIDYLEIPNGGSTEGLEECVIETTPESGIIRGLQNGKGDPHSCEALNNKNFRLAVLSCLEQARAGRYPIDRYSFEKSYGCVYQGDAALRQKQEWNGQTFEAGTPYSELVDAMRASDIWADDAPKRYFEKAKEELGASFFDSPVDLPFVYVMSSGDQPSPSTAAYFEKLEEASKKAEGLFAPAKISKTIEWSTTEETVDKLYGCLRKAKGEQLSYDDPLLQLMDYATNDSILKTF